MSEDNGNAPEIIIVLSGATSGVVLDKAVNVINLMTAGLKAVAQVEDLHAATGLVIEVKRQLEPQIQTLQKRGVEPQDIAAVTEKILERGKAAKAPKLTK